MWSWATFPPLLQSAAGFWARPVFGRPVFGRLVFGQRLAVRLAGISARLASLPFRRKLWLAALLGAGLTLTAPPVGLWPLLPLLFPPFLWLLRGAKTPRGAFAIGFFFFWGYWILSLYWIGSALLVDPEKFAWLLPFACLGLPALLALYGGLAAFGFYRFCPKESVAGALCLAAALLLAEGARGHLFTGFPWNLWAYSWHQALPVWQSLALLGAYGLSALTLLFALLPAALADRKPQRGAIAFALAAGLIASLGLWGAERLAKNPTAYDQAVRIRLVQPNIPQAEKSDREKKAAHFQTLLSLSAEEAAIAPTLILWPESAAPYFLPEHALDRLAIAAILPKDSWLITGGVTRKKEAEDQPEYDNSLLAINDQGQIAAQYDKAHLVPFGEYIPGRAWLKKIFDVSTIAGSGADFTQGPGPQSIQLDRLPPFSPAICYEAIFPGAVTPPSRSSESPSKAGEHSKIENSPEPAAPRWLLVLTNDGWFGKTAGPHQHFFATAARAIEEGIPLIRVANSGISAIIDPYGRIVQQLSLGTRGIIDTVLPMPAAAPPHSNHTSLTLLSAFALLILLSLWKRKNWQSGLG